MSDRGNPFLLPGARDVAGPSHRSGAPGSSTAAGWRLILSDGVAIPVDRPLVLGRDPALPEGLTDARPVAVHDDTVSKTHALLLPDSAGIRVRDLHSTNGTTLVLAGVRTPVPVDGEALVAQPAELRIGRCVVRIQG